MTYTKIFNMVGPVTLGLLAIIFAGITIGDIYSRYKFGKTVWKMDIFFNGTLIMFYGLIIYLMMDEKIEKSVTTIFVLSIAVIQIFKLTRDTIFEFLDIRYERRKRDKELLKIKIDRCEHKITLEKDEIIKNGLIVKHGKLLQQLLKYKDIP